MMKRIVLRLLAYYRFAISPLLHLVLGVSHACRYYPTCSEFATIQIQKEGIVKGGGKTLLRILYCQPFAKKLPAFLTH